MSTARWLSTLAFAVSAAAVASVIIGCETSSSPNSLVRQVAANFSGVYENDNKPLASSQSGAAVKVLVLNQTGDRLEAFDDRDLIWKGTIGEVFINDAGEAKAPFTLKGKTTVGQDVTISGQFTGANSSGGGALGTMSGTWIEDTLFATFFAQGEISSVNTNGNGNGGGSTNGTLTINPSSTVTMPASQSTVAFSASGGSGNYTWSVDQSSLGSVSSGSGSSVTYTRTSSTGTQTVRLNDGSTTRSTSVVQN